MKKFRIVEEDVLFGNGEIQGRFFVQRMAWWSFLTWDWHHWRKAERLGYETREEAEKVIMDNLGETELVKVYYG